MEVDFWKTSVSEGLNTIVGGQVPGRNELCPCKSGLKSKQCHGDPVKQQVVRRFAVTLMDKLIRKERMQKGLIPYPFACGKCGKGFEEPQESTVAPGTLMCPHCGATGIKRNESPKPGNKTTIIGGK